MDQSTTQSIRRIRSGQRKHIAHTKTRGEVSGGGKKPWRQKGTGNARVGSTRSPLWRGGGKSFGSKHQNHSIQQNNKEITKSVKSALAKVPSQILTDEQITYISTKTKQMQILLDELNISNNSILIVYNNEVHNLFRAARNIPNISTRHFSEINSYDILNCQLILTSKKILDEIKKKI